MPPKKQAAPEKADAKKVDQKEKNAPAGQKKVDEKVDGMETDDEGELSARAAERAKSEVEALPDFPSDKVDYTLAASQAQEGQAESKKKQKSNSSEQEHGATSGSKVDGDGEKTAVTGPSHGADQESAVREFEMLESDFMEAIDDKHVLERMWSNLDCNANGLASLSDIDKFVQGKYPLLNKNSALVCAYKRTTEKASLGDSDDWIERYEFAALLKNLLFYNRVFAAFDDVDADDTRRVDIGEFTAGLKWLGMNLSNEAAQLEFRSINSSGESQVEFLAFCEWYLLKKGIPPGAPPPKKGRTIVKDDRSDTVTFGNQPQISPVSQSSSRFSYSSPNGRRKGRKKGSPKKTPQKTTEFDSNPHLRLKALNQAENQINKTVLHADRLSELWHQIDLHNYGGASLEDIAIAMAELYPVLDSYPALLRAYRHVINSTGGEKGDDWVDRGEIGPFMTSLLLHNRLYAAFPGSNDFDDRVVTFFDFSRGLPMLGWSLSEQDAEQEFRSVDVNLQGKVHFNEFCSWYLFKKGMKRKKARVKLQQPKIPPRATPAKQKYATTNKESAADYLKRAGVLDAIHYAMAAMVETDIFHPDPTSGVEKNVFEFAAKAIETFSSHWDFGLQQTTLPNPYFPESKKPVPSANLSPSNRPDTSATVVGSTARSLSFSPSDRQHLLQRRKTKMVPHFIPPKNNDVVESKLKALDKVEQKITVMLRDKAAADLIWKNVESHAAGRGAKVSLHDVEAWAKSQCPMMDSTSAIRHAYELATSRICKGNHTEEEVARKEFDAIVKYNAVLQRMYAAFGILDSQHEKPIDLKDFKVGLKLLGLRLTGVNARNAFAELDSQSSGLLTFARICEWYLKQIGISKLDPKDRKKMKKAQIDPKAAVAKKYDPVEKDFLQFVDNVTELALTWRNLTKTESRLPLTDIVTFVQSKFPILSYLMAFIRAYERVVGPSQSSHGEVSAEDVVEKRHFGMLLRFSLFFNRLYSSFDDIDDVEKRTIALPEFKNGLKYLGLGAPKKEIEKEFEMLSPVEGVISYLALQEWYFGKKGLLDPPKGSKGRASRLYSISPNSIIPAIIPPRPHPPNTGSTGADAKGKLNPIGEEKRPSRRNSKQNEKRASVSQSHRSSVSKSRRTSLSASKEIHADRSTPTAEIFPKEVAKQNGEANDADDGAKQQEPAQDGHDHMAAAQADTAVALDEASQEKDEQPQAEADGDAEGDETEGDETEADETEADETEADGDAETAREGDPSEPAEPSADDNEAPAQEEPTPDQEGSAEIVVTSDDPSQDKDEQSQNEADEEGAVETKDESA